LVAQLSVVRPCHPWYVDFGKIKKDMIWKEDSITGLVFVPFWKKTSVEHRQNNIIKDSEQFAGGTGGQTEATQL
tara:strand:+ start:486 stop:707 length:222 start_codon:yes stop_codon:yes gene_type:complete